VSSAAISFDNVGKTYRLGAGRAHLRQALPGPLGREPERDGFPALGGVSFEVQPGEQVGVIGRNGAGKSTLLKLVARVIAPTTGSVCVRGNVASLIELGVGFHPDLTGAENIRFAGAVMGLPRRTIAARFDEIVGFAGVDQFLDTPVKRYSSGMLARLGFALASHVDAEIIAVDEVLAVGDAEFQRRSHDRMRRLRENGSAILLVSHNLTQIQELCTRALHLEAGLIVDSGPPDAVVQRYLGASSSASSSGDTGPTRIDRFAVLPSSIEPRATIELTAKLSVAPASTATRFGVSITTVDGLVCTGLDVPIDGIADGGQWEVAVHLSDLALAPGRYRVWASIVEDRPGSPIVHSQLSQELAVVGEERPVAGYGVIDPNPTVATRKL
jgi:lipopolysaccharide transport system ATP-binding protein